MSAENIYAAMQQSDMRNWVGPGDPAAVGRDNFRTIVENLPLKRDDSVLNFGCGIGRTSVALAEYLNEGGALVGSHIVPGQIQFCREQFAKFYQNATFYCARSGNPFYNGMIEATESSTDTIAEDEFFSRHASFFDLIVAFSVFTHFDERMSAHYLKSLRCMTKLTGRLCLTWFLDHPENPAEFSGVDARLGAGQTFSDPGGNLVFALFSLAAVTSLANEADLAIERVSYGTWRGGQWSYSPLRGHHFQDILILRSKFPPEFDASIYLHLHKDVAATGEDPVQHYLTYGYKEGRRLR